MTEEQEAVIMGTGIFITGTETGVGKTLVACGLAALLRDLGYRVGVMKPAETGCEERDSQLVPDDAVRLREASGCDDPLEKICPYRFKDRLAPSVAAERSGVALDIGHVQELYDEISSKHDITIVEGAGGLLVPVLPHYTYGELAKLLKPPIIVVAANRLGAINHLLLTVEHASCRGLSVLGYVLNRLENQLSLAADTNREALASLTAVPCLGEIPYIEGLESKRSSLSDLFEERLDLRPLAVLRAR